jgi:hypothetical protein
MDQPIYDKALMLKVVKSIGIYCAVRTFMKNLCADFAENGLQMDCDQAYMAYADRTKQMFESVSGLEEVIAERKGVYRQLFARCDKDADVGDKMITSIANLYFKKIITRHKETPFEDGVLFKDFIDEASTLDREFEVKMKLLVSGCPK